MRVPVSPNELQPDLEYNLSLALTMTVAGHPIRSRLVLTLHRTVNLSGHVTV